MTEYESSKLDHEKHLLLVSHTLCHSDRVAAHGAKTA
jgi:hypothetical protein